MLCNSTGASVGALAVTNMGRDMVVHNEFDLEECMSPPCGPSLLSRLTDNTSAAHGVNNSG